MTLHLGTAALEDECDHEDYEVDVLTGRATCSTCPHVWTLSNLEWLRHSERQKRYDQEQAYWNRVDEGRQRAKDGEK